MITQNPSHLAHVNGLDEGVLSMPTVVTRRQKTLYSVVKNDFVVRSTLLDGESQTFENHPHFTASDVRLTRP